MCFVVAQSISPGAKELLRNERVGYYDSGGSLFVPAGNIYVYVDKSSGELRSREFVNGIWLASAVHVYLDLMRSEGRAEEMAKHLRGERIGF